MVAVFILRCNEIGTLRDQHKHYSQFRVVVANSSTQKNIGQKTVSITNDVVAVRHEFLLSPDTKWPAKVGWELLRQYNAVVTVERILAPSESVKILRTIRLRNIKRPKAYTDTPYPIKVILSSATDRDLILSRKSILRSQTNVFFSHGVYPNGTYYTQGAPRRTIQTKTSRGEELTCNHLFFADDVKFIAPRSQQHELRSSI